MGVTSPDPSAVNLGELIRGGLVLTTSEAVALVHDVCKRSAAAPGQSVAFPEVDDVWIGEGGGLTIVPPHPAAAPVDPRAGAAALLDVLLPPPADRADDAVPSSLRSLGVRLLASVEYVPVSDPRDLLTILQRHLTGDPRQVLQQLVTRARGGQPAGDAAVECTPAPPPAPAPRAPELITLPSSADTLDLFDSELDGPVARHDRPAVGDVPAVWETAEPVPVEPPRGPRSPALAEASVAALILLTAAGYAGRTYIRSSENSATSVARSPSAGPEGAQPNRPGEATIAGPLDTPRTMPRGQAVEQADRRRPPATAAPVTAAPVTNAAAAADPVAVRRTASGSPLPPTAAGITRQGVDAPYPLLLPVADGAFSPSFDPSGRALLFHSGRKRTGRLLETVLDERGGPSGGIPVPATPALDEAASNYHPRISPDGRLIAFDSDRDGERGVYISNRDGSRASRVSGSGFAAVPSWSPDMKWLAFVRGEPGRPRVWNLWLRDLTGGTMTRQTSYRVGQVWNASWFPDSRHLCYSHEDRLVVLDIASGARDSFRTPRPGRLVRTPAVSPDGRRIIFQVFRDGVWILDLQTRVMRRILDDATAEEFTWDPDGRRIAYHSRRDGQWRIWMTTLPAS
jgi:YD repeat-containing protein